MLGVQLEEKKSVEMALTDVVCRHRYTTSLIGKNGYLLIYFTFVCNTYIVFSWRHGLVVTPLPARIPMVREVESGQSGCVLLEMAI
jgi:hypothetical protein